MTNNFPGYLIPVEALQTAEVAGPVREKTDESGQQKRETWTGENRLGWAIPVEIVRGTREKKLPNGRVLQTLDVDNLTVTVWAGSRPNVAPGDYVRFAGLAVGAMGGRVYVQALGVEVASEDFSLDIHEPGDA